MITFVIAGDINYKQYVETGVKYIKKIGYPVLIYDLGGLGYGIPFSGRFSDVENSKIPCKPHIIKDALSKIPDGNHLVWLDADAVIFERIDEIIQDYDIGVTVRLPKAIENSMPINAGIIFFKKTNSAQTFVENWIRLSDQDISDQPPLNKLASVVCADRGTTVIRDGVKIKVFPCEIYNNFYKKGNHKFKIKHYKSKIRNLYPLE